MTITLKRRVRLNAKLSPLASASKTSIDVELGVEGDFLRELEIIDTDQNRREKFQIKVKLESIHYTGPLVVAPDGGSALRFCGQSFKLGGCSGLTLKTTC